MEKLDKIALPSQMVCVLDDPLLQNYSLLKGYDFPQSRVDQWLALFFDAQLQSILENGNQSKVLIGMLEKARDYGRRTKVRHLRLK